MPPLDSSLCSGCRCIWLICRFLGGTAVLSWCGSTGSCHPPRRRPGLPIRHRIWRSGTASNGTWTFLDFSSCPCCCDTAKKGFENAMNTSGVVGGTISMEQDWSVYIKVIRIKFCTWGLDWYQVSGLVKVAHHWFWIMSHVSLRNIVRVWLWQVLSSAE